MARTIKARIQLKHDTEKNWNAATNFIPRSGEMIIYDPDAEHPNPRYKIGDDVRNPKALPFAVNPVDAGSVEIENEEGIKISVSTAINQQNTAISQQNATINQQNTTIQSHTQSINSINQKLTNVKDQTYIDQQDQSILSQAKSYTDTHTPAGAMTSVFQVGGSAPTNTKLLWIDNRVNQGLKYYNGSGWVIVPVAWS